MITRTPAGNDQKWSRLEGLHLAFSADFHPAMILSLLLFYLVHLAQTVHGIDTNSTTSSSPQPSGDGTPCSIWSILGSCAVTLLICIWHAIHVDIDYTGGMFDGPVVLTFWAIFALEVVVSKTVQ